MTAAELSVGMPEERTYRELLENLIADYESYSNDCRMMAAFSFSTAHSEMMEVSPFCALL